MKEGRRQQVGIAAPPLNQGAVDTQGVGLLGAGKLAEEVPQRRVEQFLSSSESPGVRPFQEGPVELLKAITG